MFSNAALNLTSHFLSIFRKQALKNDVTREDVTREIMENYRVEGKKTWFQRVKEWLASQPGISPSCYNSNAEQGGQQREGTSANICDDTIMVSSFCKVITVLFCMIILFKKLRI